MSKLSNGPFFLPFGPSTHPYTPSLFPLVHVYFKLLNSKLHTPYLTLHTPEPYDDSSPRSLTPYDEDEIFMSGAMSLPPNAVSFLATPTRSKRSTAFPFSPSSDFRVMYSSLKNPVKKWVFLFLYYRMNEVSYSFNLLPELKLCNLVLFSRSRTCSYDAQLNRIVHDPKHSLLPQSSTPQPTRKV